MTAVDVASTARLRVDRIKTGAEVLWQLVVESYQAHDWEALGYRNWDELCTREFGTSRLRLPREERAERVQSLRDSGLSLRAISAVTGNDVKTIRGDIAQVREIPTPEPVIYDPSGMDEFAPSGRTYDMSNPVEAEAFFDDLADVEPEEKPNLRNLFNEHEPWGASIDAEVEAAESVYVEPAPAPTPPITGLDGKTYKPKSAPVKPRQKPLGDAAVSAGWEIRKATERIERIVCDPRFRTNEKQVADALRGHLLYVAETVAAVLDQLPSTSGA